MGFQDSQLSDDLQAAVGTTDRRPLSVRQTVMNALAIVFLFARGIAPAPRNLTSFPEIAVRRIAANASLERHLSNIQGHIRAAHEQIAEFGADFFRFLLKKAAARSVLSKPRRDDFSFGISASVRHTDTEYLSPLRCGRDKQMRPLAVRTCACYALGEI